MLGIVLLVRKKGRKLFLPLWLFLVSIFCVYFASRALAFKLYVPDRHLQYPMTIFWIVAFCIFIWSAFNRSDNLKDTSFGSIKETKINENVYINEDFNKN